MRRSGLLVVALVAVVALGAACSRQASDQAIANEVKAKFFADPQVKAANLDVTVKKGELTILGDAPNDSVRYQAFKLASETSGVVKVDDRMTVRAADVQPAPEPEPAPVAARPAVRVRRPAPAPRTYAAAEPAPAPTPVVASVPTAPAEPQMVRTQIPTGSSVVIRMIDSIDSEVNRAGEIFRASLDAPLMADGEVVVPEGADVLVKLVESRSAGRMAGRSELRLELVRLEFQGRSYPIVSSTYQQLGTSRGKRTAATIGGGAAIGAAIGAIAGGGRGAAIGAAVGGASGTAVQVLTKGQQIRVPSETRLDFRLEAPLEISYTGDPGAARRSASRYPR